VRLARVGHNPGMTFIAYPLTFEPIFKERIWGGRKLQSLYGKNLPEGIPVGESWEISDRPGDESLIANGPLAGRSLRWLMEEAAPELLGPRVSMPKRFPLLIKIIDAQEKLSLQVHPPAAVAAKLGGEPKTEMWYVTQAAPGAELYVGLQRGVTRAEFERKAVLGTVTECFHRIPVKSGDSVFLQSGRVHALGANIVIFEVQQNSDTTYRVFDWNRVDTSGKPRQLHLAQSLQSIDFNDFEPGLLPDKFLNDGRSPVRELAKNDLFNVSVRKLASGESMTYNSGAMRILGVVEGRVVLSGGGQSVERGPGQFILLPASLSETVVKASTAASFIEIQ